FPCANAETISLDSVHSTARKRRRFTFTRIKVSLSALDAAPAAMLSHLLNATKICRFLRQSECSRNVPESNWNPRRRKAPERAANAKRFTRQIDWRRHSLNACCIRPPEQKPEPIAKSAAYRRPRLRNFIWD